MLGGDGGEFGAPGREPADEGAQLPPGGRAPAHAAALETATALLIGVATGGFPGRPVRALG